MKNQRIAAEEGRTKPDMESALRFCEKSLELVPLLLRGHCRSSGEGGAAADTHARRLLRSRFSSSLPCLLPLARN
jgi:hypothetical protein